MFTGRTTAWIAVLVCGLMAGMAVDAFAAGNQVKSTIKMTPSNPRIPSGAAATRTGAQVKFRWDHTISRPDGSRPDNAKSGDLPLPAGMFAKATGFRTCPMSTLEANNVTACHRNSVAGTAGGAIYISPISEEKQAVDGKIYFTGMRGRVPTFAIYYTVRNFPTAHSISPIKITKVGNKSKLHYDLPKLPTVPGVPDATPIDVSISFDARGPNGMVLRMSKRCQRQTLMAKIGFWDGSSTPNVPTRLGC
jgi:hypothetical protein